LNRKDFKESLDDYDRVVVNKFLQVNGFDNIFSGGDISAVKEEKTAQMAEKHGRLIARNILSSIHNKSRNGRQGVVNIRIKEDLVPYYPKMWAWVLSLGDWYCIFGYGNLVLDGLIPCLMKKGIEIITMIKIRYF